MSDWPVSVLDGYKFHYPLEFFFFNYYMQYLDAEWAQYRVITTITASDVSSNELAQSKKVLLHEKYFLARIFLP